MLRPQQRRLGQQTDKRNATDTFKRKNFMAHQSLSKRMVHQGGHSSGKLSTGLKPHQQQSSLKVLNTSGHMLTAQGKQPSNTQLVQSLKQPASTEDKMPSLNGTSSQKSDLRDMSSP